MRDLTFAIRKDVLCCEKEEERGRGQQMWVDFILSDRKLEWSPHGGYYLSS